MRALRFFRGRVLLIAPWFGGLGSACMASKPGYTTPNITITSCLEFLQHALSWHFSPGAVARMLRPYRPSSVRQYESCWRYFHDYLQKHTPEAISANMVLDFLAWPANMTNKAPATVSVIYPLRFGVGITVPQSFILPDEGYQRHEGTESLASPYLILTSRLAIPGFRKRGLPHPLCPIFAFKDYVECTEGVSEDHLSYKSWTRNPLLPRSLGRLLCWVIESADPGQAPHSDIIRGLSTSLVFLRTHSVEWVPYLGGWASFRKRYLYYSVASASCIAMWTAPPSLPQETKGGRRGRGKNRQ
ncbi:hypothetical protein E2C01_029087 [Portunus trituberculatus]|uniref:Uncharacterized protein n=1 Tax=Portunus trituberculatus TaxID=210409 RepID=A0A5B7ERB2_PORTR|nr:hypothetical protein [Portunus trituberculatus]